MGTKDNDKTAPSSVDPRRGKNPGYADENPRDREDARLRHPVPRDERAETGGPGRGPEDGAGAADD